MEKKEQVTLHFKKATLISFHKKITELYEPRHEKNSFLYSYAKTKVQISGALINAFVLLHRKYKPSTS